MLRLCLALFLLIPTPAFAEDVPNEVTVNEDFSDSTYQDGLTVSGGSSDAYIYCSEQGRYGTTGCSLAINHGTYVFEFSEDVYEVGFIVGAVNNSYDVKYYYSDSTDETIQKSAQSWGTDGNNMYDNFYKSFTDYNNDEANTDKFITKFEVTISDISVLDTLYWQYVEISVTTTSTSSTTSSTTTTSTTSTTSTTTTTTTIPPTTTTTTLPPKPEPEPEPYIEPEPLPPPPEEVIVDIVVEGVDKTYTQADVNDGTIERDQERIDNEQDFGCFMTDAQIERGDCDIPEEEPEQEVIIVVDEEEPDTEEELPKDDNVVSDVVDKDEDKDIEPIKEDEFIKEEIEIDIEKIEEEFQIELEIIELPEIIINEEEIIDEEIEDESTEIIFEDSKEDITTTTLPTVETKEERVVEEVVELTEEEILVEVAELEEVIEEIVVLDIPEVTEEEIEDFTEEELVEYEEAKEEAIEQFVEQLETEEVVEILEEVNDVGLENIAEVSDEVIEVVAQVVEQVIQIANEEELTEEQVEVVSEILGFKDTEDVQLIAESEDDNIEQAVDEFVQRAVEFAKTGSDQEFSLADAVVEVQIEEFIADPIGAIIDIEFEEIKFSEIGSDLTTDQKEKAQEVIVPTVLLRVASLAFFRKTL